MSVIVFAKNSDIIGVFDDSSEFKRESFKYIIEILSPKFSTKSECGKAIKEHLQLLYSRPTYQFETKDIKFSKTTLTKNTIIKPVSEPEKEEEPGKPKPKFVRFVLSQLYNPVPMIDIKQFILNKNETNEVHSS